LALKPEKTDISLRLSLGATALPGTWNLVQVMGAGMLSHDPEHTPKQVPSLAMLARQAPMGLRHACGGARFHHMEVM
jgi:hypothetical protein